MNEKRIESIIFMAERISKLDVNDMVQRIEIVALQGTLAAMCKIYREGVKDGVEQAD